MRPAPARARPGSFCEPGFALVASLVLVMLILVLAVGLLGLSTIELRRSQRQDQAAVARANARLALTQAIGQLQRTLGPDVRTSATAEILGDGVKQPHWTGVWSTRQEDGSSWFTRDDLNGGLRDGRATLEGKPEAIEWLVSGSDRPNPMDAGEGTGQVVMVSPGDDPEAKPGVRVPLVEVAGTGDSPDGRFGWWTGDLGVRANIAVTDPRADPAAEPSDPEEGALFRLLAAAAAEPRVMDGAEDLEESVEPRLATVGTLALAGTSPDWPREHAFDFTVASAGVLADMSEGGLKKDLTAYLSSMTGEVEPLGDRPGLQDADPLFGKSGQDRVALTAPRFGRLREWAMRPLASSATAEAVEPATKRGDVATSRALALANETPVVLKGGMTTGLQPVLVEATNFVHLSAFRLEGTRAAYQLRHHLYPRVVLWNPYNAPVRTGRSMVMIQGNGRQEMWTRNLATIGNTTLTTESQWLSFEGGRSTQFNASGKAILDTEGYNDPYIGSYYFALPATTFGPGECLVFSPARSAEYDCLSPYRPGSYNLAANELSCEVAPDPSRSYYVSGTDIGGGISFLPQLYWYAPTPYWSGSGRNGVENQGDDCRVLWKSLAQAGTVNFEDFDALPQLGVISSSLQFGAGREPRVSWNRNERMPIQLLDRVNPRPTAVPNVRTREGIRLRWFQEHPSNLLGSGGLAGTAHFEEALLANWNPRATMAMRSPWDNVGGTLPVSGPGGGPWFFGAYTRDLYDQAVSWDEQAPVPRNGRYHGNPFGPPQEGAPRHILFDLPRTGLGVVSLAQLQHAKLSEFVWHPTYAVGNSLADPRLGRGGNDGLDATTAITGDAVTAAVGGFHEDELGWSSDQQRAKSRGEWAVTARAMLDETPQAGNLVFDLSFEANRALWDRFFLSGAKEDNFDQFLTGSDTHPLPNGRLRPLPGAVAPEDSEAFHRRAATMLLDGAFNVNSTRVEAWKAMLASTRRTGYGSSGTPFPRVLDAPGGAWLGSDDGEAEAVWSGHRELTDEEIGNLATALVEQVKRRGPFLSLADFVNRRLAADETGRSGALQAAIEAAGLNRAFDEAFPLNNREPLPDYRHPDNLRDATRLEQTLKPASKAWGAPAFLTQADVLQALGPGLAARSDTFVIRAYGDAVDADGAVLARAWCEATVQRVPEPVLPDEEGLDPRDAGKPDDFGRRFRMVGFRWLSPGDI